MNKNIIGLESAYEHAKSLKKYSNMGISAGLVIDMVDRITELEAQLKERDSKIADQSIALRSYVNRYNNEPKEQDHE